MNTFTGKRPAVGPGAVMIVDPHGRTMPLSPKRSQKLANHSPDGFQWGYTGSGPAQLALAILLEVTGDKEIALRDYQAFKRDVVAIMPVQWELTFGEVEAWLRRTRMTDYLKRKWDGGQTTR